MPLSASAFWTTRVPASVAGPVPAASGMGMKPLASPCSAATRFASRLGPSCASGSTAHCMKLRIGRSRSCVGAAGDGGRHLDEVAGGLLADGGHRLEVLAGVGEHGLGVVERLGRRGHVLAGDHGAPVVADVGQRVDEAGAGRRVLLGARPLLARVVVPDEHAGAVVAQVAVLAVDEHVAGGVAAGEHVAVRHLRDGLHDDRARELGDLRRAVDLAAVLLEDVEGTLAGEADADRLEDVEGGLVDALELAGIQHVPRESGGDGIDPGGHCGNLAGVRRRQVRARSRSAGGQSRCCSEGARPRKADGPRDRRRG